MVNFDIEINDKRYKGEVDAEIYNKVLYIDASVLVLNTLKSIPITFTLIK